MGFTITRRSDDFTVSRTDGAFITPNSRQLRFSNDGVAADWIRHFFGPVPITFA